MELTLRAECWIRFCKWLAKVICPYNYCNLFYPPSYEQVLLPLFRQFFLLPKRNKKFMNLRANFYNHRRDACSGDKTIRRYLLFRRRRNCLKSGSSRSQYLFIRRGIKQIAIIIGAFHFCQPLTKFYLTSCSQG